MLKDLIRENETKVILLVMDGVGGIRSKDFPQTALEKAKTPNLDALARESLCGMSLPISMGITPGSGPAHFALFGYDPLASEFNVGRGVLEVLGTGYKLKDEDIAIRGNFATIDENGILVDRRAGRIPHEECIRICDKLQKEIQKIDDTEVIIMPVREYRFGVVLRGEGLSPEVEETDPQVTGKKSLPPVARSKEAEKTASIIARFIEMAREVLKDEPKANMVLMRGISRKPKIESFQERTGMTAAAIASYPLYRGVAHLVGMELLDTGFKVEEEFATLKEAYNSGRFNFFFLHIKKTDSYGEDGNINEKVKVIEEVDRYIPELLSLNPDVVMVTGDHSTPCALKSHSWHPVPFMIRGISCFPDEVSAFNEIECRKGALGIFPAQKIIELALANSGRLKKYGA